jgi:hypothetical protein
MKEEKLTICKRYKIPYDTKHIPTEEVKLSPHFASKDLSKLINSIKQDLKD